VSGNDRLQFLFASPVMIAHVAGEELGQAAIWHDIFVTLSEALLGLLAGTVLGTAAGLLLWGNGRIDFITRPYLAFIGSIPIFALAPILIMWFGIGLLSKVVMAGFAVFFVSLLQAYEGAHAIAERHLGFARSIAAPNGRIIRKIIIPGAVDWVIAGYKLNVGFALMGAFIGEFVSSEAGLGHYILKAGALYDMPRVMFGLLLISLLGLGMTAFTWIFQLRRRG
jgi:NitT/TauT family transport system permease protein